MSSIYKSLPEKFARVLQAICCNNDVKIEMVYKCQSNKRYTFRLSGQWRPLLEKIYRDALEFPESKIYPPESQDPFTTETLKPWDSVLLKMQLNRDADEEEDQCHSAICKAAPDIVPTFLFSFSVACMDVRVTFMEWLDGCVSIRKLRTRKSPQLNQQLYQRALAAVKEMWLKGHVLHSDMHTNNMLFQQSTGRVFIIDFGMAMTIPEEVQKELPRAVERKGAIRAYETLCKELALMNIVKRGYEIDEDEEWNDDATLLKTLKRYCLG
jgi:tRNA A-37 threonylcarbamoyl transferase component Bud32